MPVCRRIAKKSVKTLKSIALNASIQCEGQSVLHNNQNTSAHSPRPSVKRTERERNNMKNITTSEARKINGGSAYCKVCGYGWYNNYSRAKVAAHIVAQHPASVLRGMYYLIDMVF